jgi:WD40-like Beta Propeller Repeat
MTRWMLLAAAACGHAGIDARSAAGPAADPGQPARDAEIAARAAPFVDAFSNSGAQLAPGGQVVFVSTRDGLPQLYVGAVGEPDRPPRRLPVPAERVVAPRLLPDGKTLVFLSDVGSDQKFHVFRIGLDGSGLADLTPSGELRRMVPQVARRSGTMVYGAHVLDDQATRVFVQTIDGAPREIYRDPKVGFIADVSADGARALYVQELSGT